MTIKWIKPTKAYYQGAYLHQSLYYGASGGSSFLPYYISSSSSPHRLTCCLIPHWSPPSSTPLFFKGVRCTGNRHRMDDDTGTARTPPPPGSNLALSLPENCFSKDGGYDDAPLRWLKSSTNFSLYCSSFYSGVSYTPSFICYQR